MRRPDSYRRRLPIREPYDYVLIVCEGKKTEPNYFFGMRQAYNLSSANIEIAQPGATDPLNIVQYAERRLNEDSFDRVYCVFDRNGHTNYYQALRHIDQSQNGKSGRLLAITSVPCFEIWILLHFVYTSSPFISVGSQSACDMVISRVRRHLADYEKGHKGVYTTLAPYMPQAIVYAARLRKENVRTGSQNPVTQMDKIVDYLRNLKRR
jgi:hypothetical protein